MCLSLHVQRPLCLDVLSYSGFEFFIPIHIVMVNSSNSWSIPLGLLLFKPNTVFKALVCILKICLVSSAFFKISKSSEVGHIWSYNLHYCIRGIELWIVNICELESLWGSFYVRPPFLWSKNEISISQTFFVPYVSTGSLSAIVRVLSHGTTLNPFF